MDQSGYQSGYPGELVPTTFIEQRGIESVVERGLAFVPKSLPPETDRRDLISSLFDVLDAAKTELIRLEGRVDRLPSPHVLLAAMRSREAQASSQIEDTVASLRDIALSSLIERPEDSDASEVGRNRRMIELALNSPLPISRRLVCDMHRLLVIKPKDRPGMFRDIQVCIGGKKRGFQSARFVPPPADRVADCFARWEEFVNGINKSEEPPLPYLVNLALAHYQFEAIHPFCDGNGRLGRAIVNVSPVKHGILKHPVCNLSEWVQSNRQEYYDRLLAVSTHGAWKEWIGFFAKAIAAQAQLDLRRADRLVALYEKYHEQLQGKRQSVKRTKLIDLIFEHQAITIPFAASQLDIHYTSAKPHVDDLVGRGILTPVDGYGPSRMFVATDVILAIEGDDAS